MHVHVGFMIQPSARSADSMVPALVSLTAVIASGRMAWVRIQPSEESFCG